MSPSNRLMFYFLHPLGKFILVSCRLTGGLQFLFRRFDLLITGKISQFQRRRGHGTGEVGIEPCFVNVIKKGGEREIILLGHWIIFVIMTTRAFHGESEKGGAKGMHPICDILDPKLFGYAATLDFLGV